MCTYSHHSWEDFSTTCFCQCLTLRRANEYNRTPRAFQLMTPVIPLKDIVVALRQLHPLPLDLVPPPIFNYQLEHTFVMHRILFAQALATTPHLSSNVLSGMVYEHLSKCFILEDPFSRFSKLFQVIIVVSHGDIPKSMALVLGAIRLLAMVKNTNGFCLIVVGKVFL